MTITGGRDFPLHRYRLAAGDYTVMWAATPSTGGSCTFTSWWTDLDGIEVPLDFGAPLAGDQDSGADNVNIEQTGKIGLRVESDCIGWSMTFSLAP